MRTCIVNEHPTVRYSNENEAIISAKEHDLKPCHLLYISNGLQCNIGFGLTDGESLYGFSGVVKWI